MTDSILTELTVGCLLRDILRLDPRVMAEGRSALKNCYGISSALIWQITAGDTPEIPLLPDDALHLIRHIDADYLGVVNPIKPCALRSPFSSNDAEPDAGWFDPCAQCYDMMLHYPEASRSEISEGAFLEICREIGDFCRIQYGSAGFIQGLLDVLENLCSYVSMDSGAHSLFETAKLRAGIVACLYLFMKERNISNYPSYIRDCQTEESCVLVCSLDFLGIKDFKFQSAFTERLNEVTAASFYVDIFRENVLDDFLDESGITRCNLIFSGGRHLHLFLPNISAIKQLVPRFVRSTNDWLADQFQLDLYVSYGMHEAIRLTRYQHSDGHYYLNIFTKIANQKALVEAQRYSADNLLCMNRALTSAPRPAQRRRAMILRLAENFPGKPYIVVSEVEQSGIPIGPNRYAYATECIPASVQTVRVYCRKKSTKPQTKKTDCRLIQIWHQAIGAEALPLRCKDIPQMGIFRMDIDNFRTYMLHQDTGSFASAPPAKMELSKQFALFLRRDVPRLLQQYRSANPTDKPFTLCVIHEGADDIFIFGEIMHLIRFVGLMYKHYRRFTMKKISFSAGISLFNPMDTFAVNAQLAQQLMDQAKTIPGKDGVVFRDSLYKFKWEEFLHYDLNNQN